MGFSRCGMTNPGIPGQIPKKIGTSKKSIFSKEYTKFLFFYKYVVVPSDREISE